MITTATLRKYHVPADFAVPDLTSVPGVAGADDVAGCHLDATYHDTPTLRLAADQVTLCRETGGTVDGWYLCRPPRLGGTATRCPLVGDGRVVPPELADRVFALSRGEPLRPVARVRIRRVVRTVHDRDGTVLARLTDDTVAGERLDGAGPIGWREIEVVPVSGTRQVLDALGTCLHDAGARPGAAGVVTRRAGDRTRPSARTSAELIGAYLVAQRDALVAGDPGVREGDPDAVHDMRVAVRRLRSTLRTFRPWPRATTEPLRAELGWLGRRLGAVRDADVMSANLAAAIDAADPDLLIGPVAGRINRHLAHGADTARGRLRHALTGDRYATLLDRLDAALATPPCAISDRQARARARAALRRADRRLRTALVCAPASTREAAPHETAPHETAPHEAALHEARKAYKRARYAVEVLAPAAGAPARGLVRRLRDLQDLLGAFHDASLTADLLRELGMRAHRDGENAFGYGILAAGRNVEARALLARVPRARRRTRKPRVRRWLTSP